MPIVFLLLVDYPRSSKLILEIESPEPEVCNLSQAGLRLKGMLQFGDELSYIRPHWLPGFGDRLRHLGYREKNVARRE